MLSPATRAEVGIILRRLVRGGVIVGSRTKFHETCSDTTEEIHVTVFVAPEADRDLVRDKVEAALRVIPESVVVAVRAGTRSAERPKRGHGATGPHQRAITITGCILAVILAVLIGMDLPAVGRVIGVMR